MAMGSEERGVLSTEGAPRARRGRCKDRRVNPQQQRHKASLRRLVVTFVRVVLTTGYVAESASSGAKRVPASSTVEWRGLRAAGDVGVVGKEISAVSSAMER
jgi:hypothetical protein